MEGKFLGDKANFWENFRKYAIYFSARFFLGGGGGHGESKSSKQSHSDHVELEWRPSLRRWASRARLLPARVVLAQAGGLGGGPGSWLVLPLPDISRNAIRKQVLRGV